MKKVPFFLLMLAGIVPGCSKNSTTNNDNELPVITLVTPVSNEIFTAGQSIDITGTVTDNNYIAEVHIHVFDNGTGAKLLDEHIFPGGASANFDRSIVAASGITYKIEVVAIDRAVNEARKSVLVSCN
jgi:Bacterial Ig domain